MLDLTAILVCDRCNKTILQMENVDDADEARQRLRDTDWGCESEDGDDVCAACWAKWDTEHPAADAVAKADAPTQSDTSR